MKKMLFILNPNAGMRKANKRLTEILSEFNRAGYEVVTYVTAARGEATQVAAEYAPRVDAVVCCGGDGTFNETVTGVLQSGAGTPVGYIPAGSTNDFATSLKLPTDVVKAARNAALGTPEYYDLGLFGQRYFTYVASFGAFTRASYATPQNIKNALGHTAYLLEGIQDLFQIRTFHLKLELDDQVIEDDFIFGAICNSTSLGGILTLDPKQVEMQDGKFEILLVRAPRDLAELAECVQAVNKQKYNCKMMRFCSAERIKITAEADMPWSLDGELEKGHSQVEVQNLHLALPLLQQGGKK